MLTARRITLIIEKEIIDLSMESMGINVPSEYEWIKTNVFSDDIMEFEQKGKYVQVVLMGREEPVLVKESFESLENRLKELENVPDPNTLAEDVAKHLVTLLTAVDS